MKNHFSGASSHLGLASTATTAQGSKNNNRRAVVLNHINLAHIDLDLADLPNLASKLKILEQKITCQKNHDVDMSEFKPVLLELQKLTPQSAPSKEHKFDFAAYDKAWSTLREKLPSELQPA